MCCQLHHDPGRRSGVCVSIGVAGTSLVLLLLWLSVSVVAPRIELGTTRLSAVSGRSVLDYHSKSGMSGVEPPAAEAADSQLGSCSRSRRAPICTSARLIKYPVGESNPNPAGIRSPSAAPLDGAQFPRTIVSVGWEALESSSPALQTGARPSQLPAPTKKARRLCDTGLFVQSRRLVGRVSQTQMAHGERTGRLTGKMPRGFPFANVTRPQDHHFRFLQ